MVFVETGFPASTKLNFNEPIGKRSFNANEHGKCMSNGQRETTISFRFGLSHATE